MATIWHIFNSDFQITEIEDRISDLEFAEVIADHQAVRELWPNLRRKIKNEKDERKRAKLLVDEIESRLKFGGSQFIKDIQQALRANKNEMAALLAPETLNSPHVTGDSPKLESYSSAPSPEVPPSYATGDSAGEQKTSTEPSSTHDDVPPQSHTSLNPPLSQASAPAPQNQPLESSTAANNLAPTSPSPPSPHPTSTPLASGVGATANLQVLHNAANKKLLSFAWKETKFLGLTIHKQTKEKDPYEVFQTQLVYGEYEGIHYCVLVFRLAITSGSPKPYHVHFDGTLASKGLSPSGARLQAMWPSKEANDINLHPITETGSYQAQFQVGLDSGKPKALLTLGSTQSAELHRDIGQDLNPNWSDDSFSVDLTVNNNSKLSVVDPVEFFIIVRLDRKRQRLCFQFNGYAKYNQGNRKLASHEKECWYEGYEEDDIIKVVGSPFKPLSTV